MKAFIIGTILFSFSSVYGQSNTLFSKKKEECIYLKKEYNYTEKIMKIRLYENMTESNKSIVENEFLQKKGFSDFVYLEDKKIIYLHYLSFVKESIIESIIEKGEVKFSIVSNEITDSKEIKQDK